jgi:hypothetical protein
MINTVYCSLKVYMATTEVRLGNLQDDVVEWNTTGVEMYSISAFINLAINRLLIAGAL